MHILYRADRSNAHVVCPQSKRWGAHRPPRADLVCVRHLPREAHRLAPPATRVTSAPPGGPHTAGTPTRMVTERGQAASAGEVARSAAAPGSAPAPDSVLTRSEPSGRASASVQLLQRACILRPRYRGPLHGALLRLTRSFRATGRALPEARRSADGSHRDLRAQASRHMRSSPGRARATEPKLLRRARGRGRHPARHPLR